MPLDIVTIPCRTDNYAYVLRDQATGTVAVVDVPELGPVMEALQARGWGCDLILITHHHDDHIAGVADLRVAFGAEVVGAEADMHRLPPLDRAVSEGDEVWVGDSVGRVLDVSGHTVGHIAFHFADSDAAFTADSLMALGCGRVFEGTPQMWASLSKLAALPGETLVYSGHEYTQANAKFAKTIEPDNPELAVRSADIATKRARGEPTVPATIAEELRTNPFLRAKEPGVKAAVGLAGASDVDVFAEVRRRKDRF